MYKFTFKFVTGRKGDFFQNFKNVQEAKAILKIN